MGRRAIWSHSFNSHDGTDGSAVFFTPRGLHAMWLRTAQQYLNCDLVRGRGNMFRYVCQSMAKSAGNDIHNGAVLPFE